jgi:hypothetical protein
VLDDVAGVGAEERATPLPQARETLARARAGSSVSRFVIAPDLR